MSTKRHTARNFKNNNNRYNSANLAAIVAGAWDTSPFSLSYLVTGGGGAAGTSSDAGYGFGGSGGGGGLVQGNLTIGVSPTSPITFSITVGGGGAGVASKAPNTTDAGAGTPTTLVWGANTITGLGGGIGANGTATTLPYRNGGAGGSGGGGDAAGPGTQPAQPLSHPSISSQHGFPGGAPHAPSYGAGGGGAGGPGQNSTGPGAKGGGAGLRWWADGGVYAYGGNTNPAPNFNAAGPDGISAPPGSGGGGVCSTIAPGLTSGSGGSGVVVLAMPTIRYVLSRGAPGSAIVTTSPPAAPGLTSIKFTSPGTFTLP